MSEKIFTGDNVGAPARRKARYGHRDWLVWKDRSGLMFAARCNAKTLKMAMLAAGTQGRFTRYEGSSGIAHSSSSWRIAVAWYKNELAYPGGFR